MRFVEVTGKNRDDFAKFFETKGAPGFCWCMAFRPMPNRQSASKSERKKLMLERIDDRVPVGFLAIDGDTPLGWCSVAPRETFIKLSPGQDEDDKVWSITCFTVLRARRGQGIGRKLLDAAIKLAFRKGAKVVEAYPVDRTSPSYRHMGFRSMFEEAGFDRIGKAGTRRHVMRLAKPGAKANTSR